MIDKKKTLAKIVCPPRTKNGQFSTLIRNTDLSQRGTLEEIIVNLATLVGATEVHKRVDSRDSYFYEVQALGMSGYQSASNTILELSRKLVRQD